MRKSVEITLQDRGRDLTFKITEMAADDTQKYALRLASLLLKSGVVSELASFDANQILTETAKAVSSGGLERLGNIDPIELHDLLTDLLPCCEFKVDKVYTRMNRDNISQYVSDVKSLFKLEVEVIKLHLDFLQPESQSNTHTSDQENASRDTSKPAIFLRS